MKKRNFILFLARVKGVFFFILFFTSPFLINFFLNVFHFRSILNNPVIFMLINYSFCFFTFIILNIFFRKKLFSFLTNENWLYTMENALTPALKAFGIGFGISFLVIFIFENIPVPDFLKEWMRMPNEGFIVLIENLNEKKYFEVLFLFFFIIVAAPVFEEIIFRGFLQESLQRFFKKEIFVIPTVSLVFGFAHFNSLSNMIFAFVVGLFLSKKRKESGSIGTSIWMHSIINISGLLTGIIFIFLKDKIPVK